jgi:hypothetical protein
MIVGLDSGVTDTLLQAMYVHTPIHTHKETKHAAHLYYYYCINNYHTSVVHKWVDPSHVILIQNPIL